MRLEGFMRGGEGPERVRCCWRIVNMKAWVFHESMVSIHYNTNCHESGQYRGCKRLPGAGLVLYVPDRLVFGRGCQAGCTRQPSDALDGLEDMIMMFIR